MVPAEQLAGAQYRKGVIAHPRRWRFYFCSRKDKPAVMKYIVLGAVGLTAIGAPAFAEVKTTADTGFNIVHIAEVEATPDMLWKRLLAPKEYWSKAHSWSGSSEGFYIDAQAGGCFCELFQEKAADGKIRTTGSVEHMRVIFAQPGKVLRMQGALGPLQSEAVTGTLTVAIEPVKASESIRISFSYVVGGYMRYKVAEIAPAVDKVLGEQFKSLLSPFTVKSAEAPKAGGFSIDVEKLEDPAAAPEKAEQPSEAAEPADRGR
jgi:hypothetical protein